MLWMCATLLLLSEARGHQAGTNHSNPSNSTTSSAKSEVRYRTFNLGSDVIFKCNNRTWNETLYILWKLDLRNRQCQIGFDSSGQSTNDCRDGKTLKDTPRAQPYLHIPKFSENDVGVYECESTFRGGTEIYKYNVGIKVPPTSNAWLEVQNGTVVAVCRVNGVKPAANISWNHEGTPVNTLKESNDTFVQESRLVLPQGADADDLRCTVRHPDFPEVQIAAVKKSEKLWTTILPVAGILIFLAAAAFFVRHKLTMRPSQRFSTSPPKSAPREEVEEVEPYASYVQRVNSIYNSSADLFA